MKPDQKLIEAVDLLELAGRVEAGDWNEQDTFALFNILSKRKQGGTQKMMMHALRDNSLDAAKSLHDAVLPGWEWGIDCLDNDEKVAYVRKGMSLYESSWEDNPAAAWVAAILRAKHEMEKNDEQG